MLPESKWTGLTVWTVLCGLGTWVSLSDRLDSTLDTRLDSRRTVDVPYRTVPQPQTTVADRGVYARKSRETHKCRTGFVRT